MARSKQPQAYSDHWLTLKEREDLAASRITEPDHVRAYFRHVMRRDGEDVVSLGGRSIRTVPIEGRQAVAHACEAAPDE